MTKDHFIKQQLCNLCQEFVSQRIRSAQLAIEAAQAAANEETKSSSGDKYETGRAMAQLEIGKNSIQLAEALKLKQSLDSVKIEGKTDKVQVGSLVITDHSNFFIAISVGELVVDDTRYLAVSPQSPVGTKLVGLRIGATFTWNGKTCRIEQLC